MPKQRPGTALARTRSRYSWFQDRRTGLRWRPPASRMLALNLFLKLDQSVKDHLRPRGASRYVHIHRQDCVDPHHGGVVVIETTRARTDSECNHPFGVGHLIIDAPQDRRDLVTDRAHHEKHVGLAWRKSG